MTGGAYSVSSFYPADRFSVTGGTTVRGGMKTGPDHEFCPECMSWMFTTAPEIDEETTVKATTVEEAPIDISDGAVVRPIELIAAPTAKELDAPLCYQCGSKMQPAGSCYVCGTCGSTSGCS